LGRLALLRIADKSHARPLRQPPAMMPCDDQWLGSMLAGLNLRSRRRSST